jgi:modulator of FtsH protease
MQPMIPNSEYSAGRLPLQAAGLDVSFLRKVYLLVTASVAVSAGGAAFAMFAGADTPRYLGQGVAVPPLVGWFVAHPIMAVLLMLGGTFGASMVARKPGLNVIALFSLAGLMGLFIAPAVYFTQLAASDGRTLSPAPVLHAFALALLSFVGLSAYALVSRRDFSFLRGFLTMGLFVVIGASILNLFFGGAVFSLAIASAAVLLFGGFILYDTSRMVRAGETEPVPAALGLYLNFLNLFLALLRIFGARRD